MCSTASPEQPAALALQGIIAAMAGDPERGIAMLRRAIQLRPGNATWYAHLSSLCRVTNRLEEALAAGQESIRLDTSNPEHLVNLSLIFVDADDRDRAMACLLRALGLKHDHADGHLAMAQNLLALGEFDAGWMEYEWRNLTEAGKATMPSMTSAPWNGMKIPTGRLGSGGRSGIWRHDPVCPVHPDGGRTLPGSDPGMQRGNGAAAGECSRRFAILSPLDRCSGPCGALPLSSLPYLFRTRLDTIPSQYPLSEGRSVPDRILARTAWRQRFRQG